jgi:hypothetical protein
LIRLVPKHLLRDIAVLQTVLDGAEEISPEEK